MSVGDMSTIDDPHDILFSMQNSVWGGKCSIIIAGALQSYSNLISDLLVEAAEEEDKL